MWCMPVLHFWRTALAQSLAPVGLGWVCCSLHPCFADCDCEQSDLGGSQCRKGGVVVVSQPPVARSEVLAHPTLIALTASPEAGRLTSRGSVAEPSEAPEHRRPEALRASSGLVVVQSWR